LETSRKETIKQELGGRGDMVRTMVKIGRFDLKNLFTIFLRTSDVAYVSYLDKAKTKDHQT
jgi:hypothetical protein